jgi:hypothetical protein
LGKNGLSRSTCASVSQKGCSLIGLLAKPESGRKRKFNGS